MHTFYVPPTQCRGDIATITGSEQHHLRNVLRTAPGDTIRIIDGKGNVYIAAVCHTDAAETQAKILHHEFHPQSPPFLTLFLGLPKNDKLALILQKTTELGVTQIVPMHSKRSLQKPSQNRWERWRRVMLSATKQCKRPWLPELAGVQKFEDCLAQVEAFTLSLIFWENETKQHIKTVLRGAPKAESIALFVGPEGGFSDTEINAATQSGCIPVTLGSTILRTETAAIAGVAVAAYEYSSFLAGVYPRIENA